ncbi:hypothetical protein Xen7305DRAFT_00031530 [Xenococcus sp. PCC 7305]|nr:DUF433 domain-containing protein [Xenococcus sp. PCC 7305]ELS03429.1 hypothetical protein Xen7305DRAFT_00031530 [Xenococcus sp. PCC 7305]
MMFYPILAAGMTYEERLEDFPYLTREDILACLSHTVDQEQQNLIVKSNLLNQSL